MDSRAIGVFDSGIGGLTVAGALVRALPNEDVVYLGDTARLPYGAKSPEVVTRYAVKCAEFLLTQNIKLLVIACNTATAFALEHLQKVLPIDVIGVIAPGAQSAVAATRNARIGVIGTHGTVKSDAYARAIHALSPQATVVQVPCPLFVPLAEEGWEDHAATRLIAQTYLQPLCEANVDTLVLGCTHYPVLRAIIGEVMGAGVTLCDSAASTTAGVQGRLQANAPDHMGAHRFFLTDVQPSFAHVAERFFGAQGVRPERVDL